MKKSVVIIIILMMLIIIGVFGAIYYFTEKDIQEAKEPVTQEKVFMHDTVDDVDTYTFDDLNITSVSINLLTRDDVENLGYLPVYKYCKNRNITVLPEYNKAWYNKEGDLFIYMHSGSGTQLFEVVYYPEYKSVDVYLKGSLYHPGFHGLYYGTSPDGLDYSKVEEVLINSGLTDEIYTIKSFDDATAVITSADGLEHNIPLK